MKPRVAVILGPTATGKSHCGIALAKRLNGEIISGDSMLVYQRMDIGTAKPSAEELAAVPHHLIDILPPDAAFSVVDFKEKAEKIIADINSRGKLPVIVGGTGLYIKALLENYEFNTVEECSELRSELEAFAEEHGNSALYEKLQELDLVIKPDVSTICMGQAASMGAFLLTAGAKGKRFCLPNSRVMIHQPLGGYQGQATDIEIPGQLAGCPADHRF